MPYPTRNAAAVYSWQAMLLAFPFVGFTLALLSDVAYWRTGNLMWQNFSSWLLFAGLVVGGLAVLSGVVWWLRHRRETGGGPFWAFFIGGVAVLVLAFFNSLVHAGDGWTAVVPGGIALSAITFVLMLVVAWIGRMPAHRTTEVRTYA